jgi:hypothetical protein
MEAIYSPPSGLQIIFALPIIESWSDFPVAAVVRRKLRRGQVVRIRKQCMVQVSCSPAVQLQAAAGFAFLPKE